MPDPQDPPRKPRRLLTKLLVAVAATLLALLLGEVACRVKAHIDNGASMYVGFSKERHLAQGERVALIDILHMADNDKIVFELKPNLDAVPFRAVPLTTNSHGFRGPEVPEQAPPNTITIVGLGDSVMFGFGVGDGQNYTSILERLLQTKYPQKNWRVINTAVPAYNTVMEVETLRRKGLAFGPDLVILNLVPNDLVLPPYVRLVDDVYDLKRSYLLETVESAFGATQDRTGMTGHEDRDPRLGRFSGEDINKLPEQYRNNVGFGPFTAALRDLKQLSQEHGFPVVTLSTVEDKDFGRLLDAARQQGFPHVSLLPEIQDYMMTHYGKPFSAEDSDAYVHSVLCVSPEDGHPSVLQHRMIAAKLLATLEELGIIQRLLAK